ncbi:MAG: excinuclease ABC subunit UvrC [bacterium]
MSRRQPDEPESPDQGQQEKPVEPAGKEVVPSPELAAKLASLPDAPGVYLYKDRRGRVIYVGKAKKLSTRVRSYWQNRHDRDVKTGQLVRQIRDLDYITTRSETEALILESQLIKEYRPRYNIQLKDDKRYPYLKISVPEPFPRVQVVRRLAKDGARYFGPYTEVRAMRATFKFACSLFRVRTCHLELPERLLPRPCLDYQIGRCSAPCVEYVDRTAYGKQVKQLLLFLEGADRRLFRELETYMADLAGELQFEEAATVRDRLRQLERTVSRSRPVPGLNANLDACGLARDGRDACGVILRIRTGKVLTVHHFLLRARLERDSTDFQTQLLREYYPQAGDIPGEILVDHDLPDLENWQEWLGQLSGRKVICRRPQRGAKRAAVEMAAANATYRLNQHRLQRPAAGTRGKQITPADVQLQESLGLHGIPATIECFDISAQQGREAVGSLVYFRDGNPLKSRYRRFRIKRVTGSDDYAMMREVLDRYYGRLARQETSPADLVMVDGGAGQLGVAREVLTAYGFHATEVIGLAKREEIIHREHAQPPLELSRSSPASLLLQRVRNEAHRFAITYHRLLRDQRTTASILDRIPGIGKMKKLSLLHHFGSIAAIREADAEALAAVWGINQSDVTSIMTFFALEDT